MKTNATILCLCGHRLASHIRGICTTRQCPCVRGSERHEQNGALNDCQRCHTSGPAIYEVLSDAMSVMVCEGCADVAMGMGLQVGKTEERSRTTRLKDNRTMKDRAATPPEGA